MKKLSLRKIALGMTLALAATAGAPFIDMEPAQAAGTSHYINNSPGSNCSDSGAGTLSQPWCSFTPANAHGSYLPGDSILLARGSTWNQALDLTGSGTSSSWITLSAYGTGANPKILRNQGDNELAVKLTNVDYWSVQHLEVGNAANGILVYYNTYGHSGLSFGDINAHDNKGIWGLHSTNYPRYGVAGPDPWAVANNVVLSSGILITADPTLQPSRSQYFAKDISISGLKGIHNVDTIGVTALNSVAGENDYHPSLFQNVNLWLIEASNEDGNAASQYQTAGLGCPDSLRLTGTTNVSVHDSYFDTMAACHTQDGTAGVFMAFVENMTFANNTFVGVPNTGSNDQTAIDFEWHEKNIALRNNFFAANAGAGVELLNIHSGGAPDVTTGIDIDGNTFSHNDWAGTVADASIHQLGTSTTPVGVVQHNFFTEPNRPFLGGTNILGLNAIDNRPLSSAANFAADQFSSVQGSNQWTYLYRSGSTWANLPTYGTNYPGGAWQTSPAQWVGKSLMAPVVGGDVARAWKAPYAGSISLRGRLFKADIGNGTSAGNGITGVIEKVTVSGSVSQIWPTTGGPQAIGGTDKVGVATNLDGITVAAGDTIRFSVGSNGNDNSYDTASWSPSIGYTSSGTSNAWEFNTKLNYEGWTWGNQVTGPVDSGSLTLNSSGTDPYVYSQDNLGVSTLAGTRYLKFRIRNQTSDPTAKVYFTTTSSPSFSEDKSITFATPTNASGYTEQVVDMASIPTWAGMIKQIRFDPFSTAGTMLVDYIRLSN